MTFGIHGGGEVSECCAGWAEEEVGAGLLTFVDVLCMG